MPGIKASDYLARSLESHGVTCVFEMVGGMITHILDSISQKTNIRIVSVHHEQSAAFAADAYGRMTGIPGVAFATSGPGATNLLTGVGSSYFDSSPTIFITGQVNRHEMRGNRKIRQLGFQETDIVSIATPITKAAWLVNDPEHLPGRLENAFQVAVGGRPGPVLLDIPMDVQRLLVNPPKPVDTHAECVNERTPIDMQYVISQLSKAKRPLILAGGGVRASRAIEPFRKLVDLLGVPVVNSLMGVDVLPYTHPLRVGMIGSYGNRWANIALGTADFILVLGSRLDIRQTGADTTSFKGDRVIVHVDCEPGEINNRVVGCASIVADLNSFLVAAIDALPVERLRNYDEWQHKIKTLQDEWPDVGELKDAQGINPNLLMHQISKRSQSAAAFVVDVGQHQMWAAQSLELQDNQRFLTSGGMGSMGFALPAAIGAAFATRDTPIVTIAGDGGFQCNLQELQTVIRNKLPIKIVVLNNQCHGMVRQFQDSYFDGRLQSTKWGYSAPNFERISEAFGIRGRTITTGEDTEKALEWLWQDELSPALLQVMIDPKTNVYPKLAFGKGITEMEPFSKPVEMEGT